MKLNTCLSNATFQFKDVYATHPQKGRTALHLAILYNRPHCIRILVQSGADMEAIDEDAVTPISMAARIKDCTSIEILDTLGARTGHLDSLKKLTIQDCYRCKFKVHFDIQNVDVNKSIICFLVLL